MTQEVKEQVEKILQSGERDRAIRYLQDTFSISTAEATALVKALEGEKVIEAALTPTPASAGAPQGPSTAELGRWPQPGRNIEGCLRAVAKGFGIFLMVVSFMFIIPAAVIYYFQYQSIRNSDRVDGRIVQMKAGDRGASAPVVEYEWQGHTRSYESTFYSSPPDYTVGQHVPVLVNREDPNEITLDTFADRWALIVGLSVPGTLLLAISIVFLYFSKRKF